MRTLERTIFEINCKDNMSVAEMYEKFYELV